VPPERLERILKLVCGALAVLIVLKLPGIGRTPDHLSEVNIPTLASLEPKKPEKDAKSKSSPSRSRSRSSRSSGPPVPDHIKARVEAVYQSEIFGPVPRPLPMAVLGIIGEDVILRAPSGQTGLVSVGKELGGIKILEVGINRVLIEEDGKKKELQLHRGFGGESLLKKP